MGGGTAVMRGVAERSRGGQLNRGYWNREVAGGMFGGAEVPGGCSWRFEEARDGEP